MLGAGLLAVALTSIDDIPKPAEQLLSAIIVLVAAIFLVEYLARLWAAPEMAAYARLSPLLARLRWAASVRGLIGLLAVLPAITLTTGTIQAQGDLSAIFCILWVLKLALHAPAMRTLARVIANEGATLASVLIVFMIVLISAAAATHILERDIDKSPFGSIPAALWWAVVTLNTTG